MTPEAADAVGAARHDVGALSSASATSRRNIGRARFFWQLSPRAALFVEMSETIGEIAVRDWPALGQGPTKGSPVLVSR